MKCPVCGTPDLLMTERQGVEIDYCPSCRGVWLDRGELDKLIERTDDVAGRPVPSVHGSDGRGAHQHARHRDYRADAPDKYREDHSHRNTHHGYDDRRRHYDQPRKKKSLFEMFDFD